MVEHGREHYRVVFEQPRLFGMRMTTKLWVTVTLIGVAMVGVGVLVHVLLLAGGATVACIGLALGGFGYLIDSGWKKGPRVVTVYEDGLAIERSAETAFLPWSDITGHRVVNAMGGMPQFLRIDTTERKHQLLVQSLPSAQVQELAGHIASFTNPT